MSLAISLKALLAKLKLKENVLS